MRKFVALTLVSVALSLSMGVLGCSRNRELSRDECKRARDDEVASFAKANGAAVMPPISSGETLDWQRALGGQQRNFAFLGVVVDIFKKDEKYFLKVADMDHDLRWIMQCSEAEADDVHKGKTQSPTT